MNNTVSPAKKRLVNCVCFHRRIFACLFSLYLLFAAAYLLPMTVSAGQLYTTDGVNVRSQPDSSSAVYFAVDAGTAVTKTGKNGNWVEISVNGITGFIYKDYLSKNPVSHSESFDDEQTSGASNSSTYINSTEVNLRKKANSHCKVKAVLEKGENVQILSTSGNWTKIQRTDGSVGYVYTLYLGDNRQEADASAEAQPAAKPSRKECIDNYRSSAISYAEGRIGDLYSQSLRNSDGYADCSSLVRDAFLNASGKYIGDTTVTQSDTMNGYLYSIGAITDAVPGDLLYHLSGDNHTGIYLGNGRVLHASQKAGMVTITSYDESSTYWEYGCNAAAYCYEH